MKLNRLIIIFSLLVLSFGCSRRIEFEEKIVPLATGSINNGTMFQRASYQWYKENYIGACKMYTELAKSGGDSIEPFTDKECIEYMHKIHPKLNVLNGYQEP